MKSYLVQVFFHSISDTSVIKYSPISKVLIKHFFVLSGVKMMLFSPITSPSPVVSANLSPISFWLLKGSLPTKILSHEDGPQWASHTFAVCKRLKSGRLPQASSLRGFIMRLVRFPLVCPSGTLTTTDRTSGRSVSHATE